VKDHDHEALAGAGRVTQPPVLQTVELDSLGDSAVLLAAGGQLPLAEALE